MASHIIGIDVRDALAQDVLWQYAQRRRSDGSTLSETLETALLAAGYVPPSFKDVDTEIDNAIGRLPNMPEPMIMTDHVAAILRPYVWSCARIPGLEQANREAHQAIAKLKARIDALQSAMATPLAESAEQAIDHWAAQLCAAATGRDDLYPFMSDAERERYRSPIRPHVANGYRLRDAFAEDVASLRLERDDAQYREQDAIREKERLANELLAVTQERDQFAKAFAAQPKDPLMRVCVVGLVTDATGRILLIFNRTRGGWELPGGKLHSGEGWRDGLLRELREETGLDVILDNGAPYAVVDGVPLPGASCSSIIIVGHGTGHGEPSPGDDASDARWFTPSEVPFDELSRIGSASVVREYLSSHSSAWPAAQRDTEKMVQARLDALLLGPRPAVLDCDGPRLRLILRSWVAPDKAMVESRSLAPHPLPEPSSRAGAARNEYIRQTGLMFSYPVTIWEKVVDAVDAYADKDALSRRAADALRVLAENIDKGVVSDGVHHAFVAASEAVHAALAGGGRAANGDENEQHMRRLAEMAKVAP